MWYGVQASEKITCLLEIKLLFSAYRWCDFSQAVAFTMKQCTYTAGEKDSRPWGTWEVLAVTPGAVIKRITVIPGGRLSLQSHEHRVEEWVILEGCACVELDGVELNLTDTCSASIGPRVKHRLTNTGDTELVIIEVQMGDVLCEDDIIRYDDDYGRAE